MSRSVPRSFNVIVEAERYSSKSASSRVRALVHGESRSAMASGTAQEGSDYAYAGSGSSSQYGWWSVSARKLRLVSNPDSGMSSRRCMDAFIDWGTEGTGHYDGRIVRSCKPGTSESTDPAADGRWSEPPIDPFHYRDLGGVQQGWGYTLDDSDLTIFRGVGSMEQFDDAGGAAPDERAAGTGTQGYARVRTRYQDGSVKSCNPLPVWNNSGSGGCS